MSKQIIVNRLSENEEIFSIVPLTLKRTWMNESKDKFAYKCLPLNIANQYGWAVISPTDFTVSWWGGNKREDVEVEVADSKYLNSIASHFGESTFTVSPDFIVKTPENYSLYIRGIPNEIRNGIKSLDAIVETDWLPFTFTYNFKITDPGVYTFKKDEPLFIFFPIERNTIENFKLVNRFVKEDEDLFKDFNEYASSRNVALRTKNSGFQKFYLNGQGPSKKYSIKNHIKRLFFDGGTDIIE